ncbi:MAG: AcvB/VirJ family lysyl-phosphatidylglycerol hydrolase [Methylococcaceae bacterium]|nr:AcvB/VirJ family lysyl-phosphatidylglycerol hydrolase [Methylococcaceae bacterium]MDP3904359.1 AcvB/VirJ family lysyl-phosphatidylglycerol hydrolase [Methylococcaceae bacterium]
MGLNSYIIFIYGMDEKAKTARTNSLYNPANFLELPGTHHFDENYPNFIR